jgi:hypothetical protein
MLDLQASDDQEFQAAIALHRRHVSDTQMRRFEGYMAEIFTAFGMDLQTTATQDTPRRFIWGTLTGVRRGDSHLFLRYTFGSTA